MVRKKQTPKKKRTGFKKNNKITPILKRFKANISAGRKIKKNVINSRTSRVIPIPKQGGFLIPLMAGLSALGGLIGAGSSVAKVVKDIHAAKEQLSEAKRHNEKMEAIAIGKTDSGLYVKPYKTGYGLFIKKKS